MNIQSIVDKIKSASKILVLPSQPADMDCLCSALVMRWYLTEILQKEDVRIYSFFQIPDKLKILPGIEDIEQKYLDKVDLSVYDLIIGVDGNGFDRYLTNSYQSYISQDDIISKFINFDHHQPDDTSKFINELNVTDPLSPSTTYVIYKNLVKDLLITPYIATLIYAGIASDTGNFKWNFNGSTLKIAGELLDKGADYLAATNLNIPLKEIEFSVWAIQHTQYFPEIKTTLLYIQKSHYEELDAKFGDKWDFKDLDRHYKNTFCKLVEGFDYYLILKEDKKADNVRITWRMRDLPKIQVNFIQIMKRFGYEAGGHLNSASARAYNAKIEDVWAKVQAEITKVLS